MTRTMHKPLLITRHTVANLDLDWGTYRKAATTRAAFVRGPIVVKTREGSLPAFSSWVALDSEGWPYPIEVDAFAALYESAEADPADDAPTHEFHAALRALRGQLEMRTAELEKINRQLDRRGVAWPGTWQWERVMHLVDALDRYERDAVLPDDDALLQRLAELLYGPSCPHPPGRRLRRELERIVALVRSFTPHPDEPDD